MAAPVRVLLIDDDEDDYILTKEIFHDIPHREKYQLNWVNNYEEGINAMLKSHYDIYLVDYRLGKYTGLDLLHEAIKSNVSDPIIILTGKGDSKVDNEALQIGAADYLIKDQISPYTIERSIRYALKHTQALKALRESEKKFRIIFERSKEPFVIFDSTGIIRDINKAGLQFFQYEKEEIKKLRGVDLYVDKQNNKFFVQLMDEKGAVNDFETQLKTKFNEIKTVNISAFLQIDQHGTEELYYCIIHDLTHRKLEEKATVDIEKIAVTERITKKLADEIHNPLSNINLSIEQLKLDLQTEDDAVLMYIDIIKTNFEKINSLISNLVNSTQSKDLNMHPRVLNHLIEESLMKLQDEFNLNAITIHKDFTEKDLMVDVDEEQIISTILNLVLNSLQAEAKQIFVKTYDKNFQAYIEITDDGTGIKSEDQHRVFEPFFSTKSKTFGLGLTNAQKIIVNHKGRIYFTSEDNKTKFTILLPVSKQTNLWA